MIYAALSAITVIAVIAALHWYHGWLRGQRALEEWRQRWTLAPALCAVTGCLQPPEADCHVAPDIEVRAPWGHRFSEARLVRAPETTVREAVGTLR